MNPTGQCHDIGLKPCITVASKGSSSGIFGIRVPQYLQDRFRYMSRLPILEFPHVGLRRKARPVETVNSGVKSLIDNMLETMYAADGVGLSAVQVGVCLQVIVVDVSRDKDQPTVLVDPRIEDMEGEQKLVEGCLSVPGVYERVKRAKRVQVSGLDKDGQAVTHEADDLFSVCLQHEIEHLSGVIFLDHLSILKRTRIHKAATKRGASA